MNFQLSRRAAAPEVLKLRQMWVQGTTFPEVANGRGAAFRKEVRDAVLKSTTEQTRSELELGVKQAVNIATALRTLSQNQLAMLREIAHGNRTFLGAHEPRELYGTFADQGADKLRELDALCGKALAWAEEQAAHEARAAT